MTTNGALRFIDLFCGIGGFHQAIKMIDENSECVMACDIDKSCQESYLENYGITPEKDIKKLNLEKLEDFDILCGGFPCQPFSNGGKKKTFDDDRGLLFDEIIKIARVKKPRFMFLENVKHILKVGNGEVYKYILNQLDKNGYHVQVEEISPHTYGIPQQRERVYFICIRKDIYDGTKIEFPKPEGVTIDFEKFLLKKSEVDKKYFVTGDILECLNAWEEMIKVFTKEVEEKKTIIKLTPAIMANEFHKNYSDEEFKQLADWRQEYITKNKPIYNAYKSIWDEWYEQNKSILTKREIYGKLEWQVGNVKEKDSIFNYFIQVRQSGVRVKKAEYFPTLVAIVQVPIYGKEKRYITPRECARLQSFPDTFKIHKDDKKAYKQFGNSVSVENVKTVISTTLKKYNII